MLTDFFIVIYFILQVPFIGPIFILYLDKKNKIIK